MALYVHESVHDVVNGRGPAELQPDQSERRPAASRHLTGLTALLSAGRKKMSVAKLIKQTNKQTKRKKEKKKTKFSSRGSFFLSLPRWDSAQKHWTIQVMWFRKMWIKSKYYMAEIKNRTREILIYFASSVGKKEKLFGASSWLY